MRQRLGLLLALPILIGAGLSSAWAAPDRSGAKVHLPADQAAHPAVHNEWWYIVGHLRQGNRTFGYQITAFKFGRIKPPGFSAPITLYRSDVAVTDETRQRFYHKVTYYFPQSVQLSTTHLGVNVGAISLTGSSLQRMSLQARLPQGRLDFNLSSLRPAMLIGGNGYLPMGNGYTYYYSLTDLATSGTLRLNGTDYHITGESWLDHQWGDWSWQSIRGWTWMAWQLNNGIQMSIFDFRSTAGQVEAASVLLRNGSTYTDHPISITAVGTWRSPHDGAVYPSGWIVHIPALRVTMRVTPTVRDQEVVDAAHREVSYWEGSSRLQGTYEGKPVAGLGYTELTGYTSHSGVP